MRLSTVILIIIIATIIGVVIIATSAVRTVGKAVGENPDIIKAVALKGM